MHALVRNFYLLPKFLSNEEKGDYLKSYTMVTFGRHPFVRLVSTYKDMFIDQKNHRWKQLMTYDEKHPYSVIFILA